MVNKTIIWIQVIVTVAILATSTLAIPTDRNDYNKVAHYPYISDMDSEDYRIKQAVYKFLLHKENQRIRDILRQTGAPLEDDSIDGSFINDMPLHTDHIWTILNAFFNKNKKSRRRGDVTRRRHNKRSVFDSIAHSGEFGGFGKHHVQKLEFTFENLLPYLIKEMKRNRRQVPKYFLQK